MCRCACVRVHVGACTLVTTKSVPRRVCALLCRLAVRRYKLRLVEPSEIDASNYFTLSQKGITHFCGDDSEFTSIHQYEREYYLYNMVTSIPFFQKYRKWKTFVTWKKNVSAAMMNACKASLQQNLFILNPLLRKSLIALRKLSYEVANFRLYHVDPRTTYTLDEFCEHQVRAAWLCGQVAPPPPFLRVTPVPPLIPCTTPS